MKKRGHPPSKPVVFHDNKVVIVPPGIIGSFGEGECESPLGEESGGVVLSSGTKKVKVRGREGTCEKMVREGCDMSVICCAIGIIRAAGKCIGAISGARFMDKDEIVIA